MEKKILKLLEATLSEYDEDPINFIDEEGATKHMYLKKLKELYAKTLFDVSEYADMAAERPRKILEVGSFLGIVSIVLSKLGFDMSATDIPEFMDNVKLQKKLLEHNISFRAVNLKHYSLPYDDNTFDIVVISEVLEHLNFNPLPVIQELNRIIKKGGLLYLTVPNIARFDRRKKILLGKSILTPIKDYYFQLDPKKDMIVGLHWREYDMSEVKDMLEGMGFQVIRQEYFQRDMNDLKNKKMAVRSIIKKAVFSAIPALKETQIAFAVKKEDSNKKFLFTDATTP